VAAAVPETRPAIHDVAFERLYRRYVKDVYRYTLALLQNPADAEDVTQTTFLNAWRAYRRGVEPQKPHNWLIKIAHNAARTRYAVSARRPHEVAYDEGVHELPVSAEDAPDLEGVLQSLAKLPFNQRAALVMRELEGRSYSEIADALEVSVSAVETLIFRARRSLRLHRSKLRVLGAVQLPPSLATFFENGGGAVVGGGALVGSGLLAKAAVVIATGIAAGGVGYGAVQAADHRGSGQQSTGLVTPSQIASTTFSPLVRLVRRRPHERGQGDRRWRALHLRAHERGRGQVLGRRAHRGRLEHRQPHPGQRRRSHQRGERDRRWLPTHLRGEAAIPGAPWRRGERQLGGLSRIRQVSRGH